MEYAVVIIMLASGNVISLEYPKYDSLAACEAAIGRIEREYINEAKLVCVGETDV